MHHSELIEHYKWYFLKDDGNDDKMIEKKMNENKKQLKLKQKQNENKVIPE